MNHVTLNAVPTLDELLANPIKTASLPPEAAKVLLAGVAGLLPMLIAQASRPVEQPNAVQTPLKWISVEEAASRFGVTPRWLYKHKHQLPSSSPSRKVLLFDEMKLAKWFAAQK